MGHDERRHIGRTPHGWSVARVCRVVTPAGLEEALAELLAMGFDAVLVKQVDPFEMVTAVADALRGR